MRVFFYYTLSQTFTSALVKLSITGSSTSDMLAYFDNIKAFENNYDPGLLVSAVTKVAPRQWCFADFGIMGYDDQLATKTCLFTFEWYGVNESILKLTGGVTLNQVFEKQTLGLNGTSSNISGYDALTKSAKNGVSIYKD